MASLSFNDLILDMEIPRIVKKIDQKFITRNAVASLDYNPIHTDPDWAKKVNLLGEGTTIAHGLCTISIMVSVVTDWCYPAGGRLKGLNSRFIAPVRPGSTLTCRGIVTELHPRVHTTEYATLKLTAEDEKGELKAVSHADVELPSG